MSAQKLRCDTIAAAVKKCTRHIWQLSQSGAYNWPPGSGKSRNVKEISREEAWPGAGRAVCRMPELILPILSALSCQLLRASYAFCSCSCCHPSSSAPFDPFFCPEADACGRGLVAVQKPVVCTYV